MCTLDWVLFAFAIVAVIEKQHVESVGQQTSGSLPSKFCNEADMKWPCLPRKQGCSEVGVLFWLESPALKAIGGAAGTLLSTHQAGLPALPKDDSLFPGSANPRKARFLMELGRSTALVQLYICQTRTISSLASSRSSKQTSTGLCTAQCPKRLSDGN